MTAPAMSIGAATPSTRVGFIAALKSKASGGWSFATDKAAGAIRTARLDKAFSTLRRYTGVVLSKARNVVSRAGVIPMALLAATSSTGQKAIGWTLRTAAKIVDKTLRVVARPIGWVVNLLGGRKVTESVSTNYAKATTQVFMRYSWASLKLRAIVDPQRPAVKAVKTVAFMWALQAFVRSFALGGPWTVAIIAVGGLTFLANEGILEGLTARAERMTNRFRKVVEDEVVDVAEDIVADAHITDVDEMVEQAIAYRARFQEIAKSRVQTTLDEITATYGPDLQQWDTAVRGEHKIALALLDHYEGNDEAFSHLSAKQKARAEAVMRKMHTEIQALLSEQAAQDSTV